MQWQSRLLWIGFLLFLWLFATGRAQGETLTARLQQFPNWQSKPSVPTANGDLIYPTWFLGEWTVTTTLVDQVAPLAPDIVTPGFDANQQYLNQPVTFCVRFIEAHGPNYLAERPAGLSSQVIADRAFNGLNLAKAYLGQAIYSVKVDPNDPNRQITLLRGDRQLISTITKRATATPAANQFIRLKSFNSNFGVHRNSISMK